MIWEQELVRLLATQSRHLISHAILFPILLSYQLDRTNWFKSNEVEIGRVQNGNAYFRCFINIVNHLELGCQLDVYKPE